MKKFLSIFFALLMCFTVVFSYGCGNKQLDAPVITLEKSSKNGYYVASWEENPLAINFIINVDGVETTVKNTVTTKELRIGETIKVKAVSDGAEYSSSEWSESVICKAEGRSFEKFNSLATPKYKLPGCDMLINPQSIDVSEEMGLVFVAGYYFNIKGDPECSLWVLDLETTELLATYTILETDGQTRHYSYVGGLAVTEKNLFISSKGNFYRISLSKFANPADGVVIIDEKIPTHAKAANCCYADGVLWVGDFWIDGNQANYQIPSDRPVPVGMNEPQAWAVGYILEDTDREIGTDSKYLTAAPDYVLLIGEKIRGFTFQNGCVILTKSYGGVATLYFKENPILSNPNGDTTVTIDEKVVPVWNLPKSNVETIGPMSDPLQISNFNDDLLLVFGSGTKFYGKIEKTDTPTEFAWLIKFPDLSE